MKNELKKRLYGNEVCFGTWIGSASATSVDILKNLHFDWLVFDSEHSPISEETISRMMQTVDGSRPVPLVRVGENNQYLIKQALDAGAFGVVLPLINTGEDAQRAVSFAMYPPVGIRGSANTRASKYGIDSKEYLRSANQEIMLIPQVETKIALDNLDEILQVRQVDVAFVGPADLTMSLGLIDDRTNPKVTEAMKKVVDRCVKFDKIPGIMAGTPAEVNLAIKNGFRFISLASDTRFLIHGAMAFLNEVGRS